MALAVSLLMIVVMRLNRSYKKGNLLDDEIRRPPSVQ